MEYCIARRRPWPVDEDFCSACNQIDQTGMMLTGLQERAWPDTDGRQTIAMARPDPTARQSASSWMTPLSVAPASIAMAEHGDEQGPRPRSRMVRRALARKLPMADATARPSRLRAIEHGDHQSQGPAERKQWHTAKRTAIRKHAITIVMDLGTPDERAAHHLMHAYCRRRIGDGTSPALLPGPDPSGLA